MQTIQEVLPRSVSAIYDMRWKPRGETLLAFISYILVLAGLYAAFQVFTTDRVAANFITFGPVTLAGFGVALPVIYTVLVPHQPISDLGVTSKEILPSLLLGLDTYSNTLGNMAVTWNLQVVPLVTMSLAVRLFEAVFFRGWLQMRFESAFGLVPGLILGALCLQPVPYRLRDGS